MNATLAIANREFASYFRSSIGWVVIAAFLFLSGFWFAFRSIAAGLPATMQPTFAFSQWILLMVAPAISMRLIAEEQRTGTIEPLMAAPVSDWAIVVGKYLGSLAFLAAMLAPTLLYVLLLEILSSPDYGPIIAGYTGVLLLGALYLAVGLFFSSTTKNQVVALLATIFFLLALELGAAQAARFLGSPWDTALFSLLINLRLADFAQGVIDTKHVVFFLASSTFFIVLAVTLLESRRWR